VLVPTWAKQVIVLADAGFSSKATFRQLQEWNWGYVMRMARYSKLADGRKLADVIAKKRSHHGPKAVRVLVTNLSLEPKVVLAMYQRRWYVEVLFKELKGTLALSEHQVNSSFDS